MLSFILSSQDCDMREELYQRRRPIEQGACDRYLNQEYEYALMVENTRAPSLKYDLEVHRANTGILGF
jgi:hypothetical protein